MSEQLDEAQVAASTVDPGIPGRVALHEFGPDSDASGARRRLFFLDGLRALTAIYVLLGHAAATTKPPSLLVDRIFSLGTLSVGTFIVVSGYSLGIRAVGARDRQGYGTYMRRRAWRILPPYLASLVVSVVLILTVIGKKTGTHWDVTLPLSWKGVWIHSVLMQDVFPIREPNHVFWSIAVEWHLYFVFPLFVLLLRRFGRLALLGAAAVGTALLWTFWGGAPYVGFPPQLLVLFIFGILAADISAGSDRVATALRQHLQPTRSTALLLACAALGSALAFYSPDYFAGELVLGVGVGAFIVALAAGPERHLVRRLLECRPLVWVGFFSYSLYLVHAPIVQIVWQYGVYPLHLSRTLAFVATLGLGLVASLAGAFLFHLAVERPFLNHRSVASLRRATARRIRWRSGGVARRAAASLTTGRGAARIGNSTYP